MCKFVLKKTSRDFELDTKWRVVAQKSSTRARVEDVSVRKFVKKKTSCGVELDVKWRVVVQKSSTRGRAEDVSMHKAVLKSRLVTSN